jgi:tRNA (guanine-N7-)-methyltransferase
LTVRRLKRLSLDELAPYLLEVPADAAAYCFDATAVFGNDHPVEIEVGFGKGLFLLTAGQACPAVNFLGIETERKYQLYAANRIAKRGLRNVRLLKADAREFFRAHLPDAAAQAIHVYFPDPWWKKRHHKRRLFTPEFAAQGERVLRPGGKLHLVTDVADYFAVMTQLVAEQTRLQPLPPPDARQPEHDMDYLTNFERKFRQEGRAIYRACYVRPTSQVE